MTSSLQVQFGFQRLTIQTCRSPPPQLSDSTQMQGSWENRSTFPFLNILTLEPVHETHAPALERPALSFSDLRSMEEFDEGRAFALGLGNPLTDEDLKRKRIEQTWQDEEFRGERVHLKQATSTADSPRRIVAWAKEHRGRICKLGEILCKTNPPSQGPVEAHPDELILSGHWMRMQHSMREIASILNESGH
jgi:hypothetical protein